MAVAAPARKAAPAPPPSRTSPPPGPAKPARRVRHRPAPRGRAAAPAPTRGAPRRKSPTRRTPARAPRPRTRRAAAARPRLVLVVGRTATAVRQLPDSGLVVRMTRGRAWIAVLGVLLVGIVALNVVTLGLAATSSRIGEEITALEGENEMLRSRSAREFGIGRVRHAAAPLGLSMPASDSIQFTDAGRHDAARAAARLAAAGG